MNFLVYMPVAVLLLAGDSFAQSSDTQRIPGTEPVPDSEAADRCCVTGGVTLGSP